MFAPVEYEGEEMFVAEVHHGEEAVHETLFEPLLCVLEYA